MKKVLVVLVVAAIAGTSCKKETIGSTETYENLPVLEANIGEKITFQVVAVETGGNEIATRESWLTVE